MKNVFVFLGCLFLFTNYVCAQKWYKIPDEAESRWVSFENPKALKGGGAVENSGAKGHAFHPINAGETITLLDLEGAGIIHRIWLTVNDRSPKMLRSLRIEMYWDGSKKPAVSAPLGDFFGIGLGQRVPFENELFSDPEGRSFNCFIPMPFKKSAKITITNDSDLDLRSLFYDINLTQLNEVNEDILYFHAFWNRNQETELTKDYEIIPYLKGKGRFLGVNMGVQANPIYENTWWGEGEIKIYLDGDKEYPTLVGTGTEDYIGTGWGQGTFSNRYQGSLISDTEKGMFAFYRFHIPDPIYFRDNIKVTIQQIGGCPKEKLKDLIAKGAPLLPISIDSEGEKFIKLLEAPDTININDPKFPDGWTNFYRQDDISSMAYFYLDSPTNNLTVVNSLDKRVSGLILNKQ